MYLVIILIHIQEIFRQFMLVDGVICNCTQDYCQNGICEADTTCFTEYLQTSPSEPMKFNAKGCVRERQSITCSPIFIFPTGNGPKLYNECCDYNYCNKHDKPNKAKLKKFFKLQKLVNKQTSFNNRFIPPHQPVRTSQNIQFHPPSGVERSREPPATFQYPLTLTIIISSLISLLIFIFLIFAIFKLITIYTKLYAQTHQNTPQNHLPTQHQLIKPDNAENSLSTIYASSSSSSTTSSSSVSNTDSTNPLICQNEPIYLLNIPEKSYFNCPASSCSLSLSTNPSMTPSNLPLCIVKSHKSNRFKDIYKLFRHKNKSSNQKINV